ncbi:MAG: hypothetical protein V2J65_29015 [Desulfobacteraceae bacterium]|jgi:hypothetical protein|nr:hypothetical protein [Desulfobacteraceae bacterium]
MSASYWKMVGENIAKGVGEKTIRRLGTSGKVLGRAGAVVGIGFMAYELYKSYKDNIENEPAYQEMMILQAELEKWTSAISCIGSEPAEEKEFGSFEDGGAINALYRKKVITGKGFRDADPKEAYALLGRSMNYIRQTENLLGDASFDEKKNDLVSQVRKLQLQISDAEDYRPIQNKLSQIVAEIRPIAGGYAARVYDCSREIQKTLGSNAAWAAVSMATLGLVKKPSK